MKFETQGEWTVGTPIIAGSGTLVELALRCNHLTWKEECRGVEQDTLMVMERCTSCIATRAKYRPVKEGDRP